MSRKVLFVVGASMAMVAIAGSSALADESTPVAKLAIGTPAAKDSPWGHVFKTWKVAVEKKTGDKVTFEFFYNSTKGTEATMVDKMKAGELDGAAVTSIGLGKLDKRLLTVQMPGVMHSWKTVDAVRTVIAPDYDKIFKEKGVTLVTYGDVGYAHFLGILNPDKGLKEVHTPDDLNGRHPWVYSEDPVQKAVWSQIKGVSPFPAELMQVGNNIGTNIDCMEVSALAAEMLQWNSKFTFGIDDVPGIVVGAVIMSNKSLDALPADAKQAVIDTGAAMGSSNSGLKVKIRNEDKAAWDRFKARSGVSIYAPNDDDKKKWNAVFTAARENLKKQPALDAALITKIETTAAANQ